MGMKKLLLVFAICIFFAIPALAALGGLTNSAGISSTGIASVAQTVLTNANLTGPIISIGNTTSLASSTGAGSTIVTASGPNGAMSIPGGNTAQRSSPTAGMVRWNTDISGIEVANGSSWNPFAAVALSGSYTDLINTPSFAAVATTGAWTDILGKPTIVTYAYEETTKRTNAFWVSSNATVGATSAVYQLTSDGTSTGTALCPNGVILGSAQPVARDATLPYSYGVPVISNSNKTLTIPVNKSSGILTVLTLSVLGAPVAATGSSVDVVVMCY